MIYHKIFVLGLIYDTYLFDIYNRNRIVANGIDFILLLEYKAYIYSSIYIMIAFSIGLIDIYRYGIFYFITFFVGYIFLYGIAKKNIFGATFPRVQNFLEKNIDDLILCIFFGVLLGGRLGHVIIYDIHYYIQNPSDIFKVRQGGMSFIGGIFGVTIALIGLAWRKHLKFKEILLIGDIIFTILPFGIMLGRIGNFLNQELYGVVVSDWLPRLGYPIFSLLNDFNIFHVYTQIDNQLRVNTNFLASFFEGLVLFIITLSVFRTWMKTKKPQPGKIIGIFLIGYSIVRFFLEYVRADSQLEFHGLFSTSQRFFLGFFVLGIGVLTLRKRLK